MRSCNSVFICLKIVVIPIAACKPNEVFDQWVPLVDKKNSKDQDRGELHVNIKYVDPTQSAPQPSSSSQSSLNPQSNSGNSPLSRGSSSSPAQPPLLANVTNLSSSAVIDWLIPFEDLTLSKELGRGAFGVVYKGKWRLQDCAIKVVPNEKMGPKEMEEFKGECALMASIRPHHNLITFLGVSMDQGKPLCLVTDFV